MSTVRIAIPIEIRIRIGDPAVDATSATVTRAVAVAPSRPAGPEPAAEEERFFLDEDYTSRRGYEPDFLGVNVPLPRLNRDALELASRDYDDRRDDNYVLRYHKFSIVNNRSRRMCFFTACVTTRDPELVGTWSRKELSGGRDKWILDPRIPPSHQVTTAELYGPLEFDRGHVVRRDDVYWGTTEPEAQYANFDTFHYTNCTPQHPRFNQSSSGGLWGKLENHIAQQSEDHEQKLVIFAGPRFQNNDPWLNGVKIPRQYWKVVLARERGKELRAWAFLLSQARLVEEERRRVESEETLEDAHEGFDPGEFSSYQVSISWLQPRLQLTFSDVVRRADMKSMEEGVVDGPRRIETLESIGAA